MVWQQLMPRSTTPRGNCSERVLEALESKTLKRATPGAEPNVIPSAAPSIAALGAGGFPFRGRSNAFTSSAGPQGRLRWRDAIPSELTPT
jgi:hypothetical protein